MSKPDALDELQEAVQLVDRLAGELPREAANSFGASVLHQRTQWVEAIHRGPGPDLQRPRVLQVQADARVMGWLFDTADTWLFAYAREWALAVDSFDLSPALPRAQRLFQDGASRRTVQWYFDNLLPEEQLLRVLANAAELPFSDAFGLLRYYGAESAGSLVLLPLASAPAQSGLHPLAGSELSRRIRDLSHTPLTSASPKRMSLAGAQHKLVVVATRGQLFEPLPGTPSTHILKPNSPSPDYPCSAMNEYFVMRLAKAVGLVVPRVALGYVPEPCYLIERFDRKQRTPQQPGEIAEAERTHIIDTCQLLDKSRSFKYAQANMPTLLEAVKRTRKLLDTRKRLFEWLVFNVLVGNSDNHLKNLSFQVTGSGVDLAPHYDMLCTAVYETPVYADHRATWPQTPLAFALPGATTFGQVTYQSLVDAGLALGLKTPMATRLLDAMLLRMAKKADELLERLTRSHDDPPGMQFTTAAPTPTTVGAERHLLRAMVHVVIKPMIGQVQARQR